MNRHHSKEVISESENAFHKSKDSSIIEQFRKFILEDNHPCIMAQSVCTMENIDFHVYGKMGEKATAQFILEDLSTYLSSYDFQDNNFFSFIAIFSNEQQFTEKEFEDRLWQLLQYLHQLDDTPWDESVSGDPEDDDFSFSLLGKAFYVVGMHPNSSRKARQSPLPAMVFNLHGQFEKLREMGVYQKVRDRIRKRDIELQGSINPMLKDFGDESEAKQYSGRKVEKQWKCPFHP